MTTLKTLMMFAAAGLLAPAAVHAEIRTASTSMVIPAPTTDKAPVSGTPARLRRTNEEQAGNEMSTLAFFDDGKSGFYFAMSTELNGQAAPRRMQLALVPFSLVQDATTGAVSAQADLSQAKFVTNNNGNEYRNANHPAAFPVFDGKLIAVEYNYQPANSNDTKRYIQVFNKQGQAVLPQTEIFAKNNDDASMNGDAKSSIARKLTDTKWQIIGWRGANGNGADDGWVSGAELTCNTELTQCSLQKRFDVSVCPREERSHGTVSFVGSDENTVIASWTEGNSQPQMDGVWMAAIDVSPNGQNGANAQNRIAWKKNIAGRVTINGARHYAMRMMHEQIMDYDKATGALVPTDLVIARYGVLRGNNNANGKGGTYTENRVGVYRATRAGLEEIVKPVDISDIVLGTDGTHLGMRFALFGTTNALVPGFTFLQGSHTGGGRAGQVRAVTFDMETGKFANAGVYDVAPYDRHLYPNYLGNNPGNQGRNYANGTFIANPYVGQNGNTDAHLMVYATTGKDPSQMMDPSIKLAAYISVLPVSQTPNVVPGTPEEPEEPGTPEPGTPEEPGTPDPGNDEAGTALGGCSTTGTTSGLATLLLVGLAALFRRRR